MSSWVGKIDGSEYYFCTPLVLTISTVTHLFDLLQIFDICELGALVAKFPYSGVF